MKQKILICISLLFLVAMLIQLFTFHEQRQSRTLSYPEFLQALEQNKFQKASIHMGYDLADIALATGDCSIQLVDEVSTWPEFAVNTVALVLLFIVVIYISVLRQRTRA
jgi:FtsH-like protein